MAGMKKQIKAVHEGIEKWVGKYEEHLSIACIIKLIVYQETYLVAWAFIVSVHQTLHLVQFYGRTWRLLSQMK